MKAKLGGAVLAEPEINRCMRWLLFAEGCGDIPARLVRMYKFKRK
jgi:hypothetical protein